MDKIRQILTRGVEEIIVKENLEKKLNSDKKLRIYYGIDPTGSKLHLGHSTIFFKLKEFQELGHEVILLIGDFTARIGDPTGKDKAREPLTEKQIQKNMKDYKKQAGKILDFKKIKIKYNSQWLSKLKFQDIINLASNFTVQQMLDREMFQQRIKQKRPISVHEFLYPLMQGYDAVAMDVDVEIGGSDQYFNMMVGRDLQKIYNKKDKEVLTTKLLTGTDGRKMSKTFNNIIALNAEPNDMFGKIMSMRDEIMASYFELATRLSQEEIKKILKQNPRDAKARLAREIVLFYYNKAKAEKAEQEFNKVFRDKKIPSKVPEFKTASKDLVEILVQTKLASSKADAKRLIKQGAVKRHKNNILQVGKRGFVRIKL